MVGVLIVQANYKNYMVKYGGNLQCEFSYFMFSAQ